MTRTPTIIVTANAIAARAFAWGIATNAQHVGSRYRAPMISPLLP